MDLNVYIPPSNDDTYDQEVFQHFLQRNQVTSVSNPEYQPVSSPHYSQLMPVSSTFGKYQFSFFHIIIAICTNTKEQKFYIFANILHFCLIFFRCTASRNITGYRNSCI